MPEDIRWLQRFSNFRKAFAKLEKAVQQESFSELEKEGLIQRFEYTYELAWNTLGDYLKYQGYTEINGPRNVIEQAYKTGIIKDGEGWMQMLQDRNKTSHTYNESLVDRIFKDVKGKFYSLFRDLIDALEAERKGR
jgi:nucleotidyltransferase substrate binding protein (TIGR01987 family)